MTKNMTIRELAQHLNEIVARIDEEGVADFPVLIRIENNSRSQVKHYKPRGVKPSVTVYRGADWIEICTDEKHFVY